MAHAQKPDFVFRRKGRVHLNRRGRQFSRLLAAELCASAVVMLDTPCYEVVWRVLATYSIRQFPLLFLSRPSPCAIIFQLDSTRNGWVDTDRGKPKNVDSLPVALSGCSSQFPRALTWEWSWPDSMGYRRRTEWCEVSRFCNFGQGNIILQKLMSSLWSRLFNHSACIEISNRKYKIILPTNAPFIKT